MQNSFFILSLSIISLLSIATIALLIILFKKIFSNDLKDTMHEQQMKSLQIIQDSIQNSIANVRTHLSSTLTENAEKTANVFTDVVKRLALIDNAQQKISELTGSVKNLQEILADKRARGAFGEMQLAALIRDVLPEKHFALQYTLSNGKRADCILFLPRPTGNMVIDAKFPLDTYRRLTDIDLPKTEQHALEQQFRADISKHLQDIASKYIIENETTDGAMMFIPAEAIFAEIHSHYPDLIEKSHKLKVWMVSPTTMMAILTTARAVLKDAATRKQIHIIQEHLGHLGKDFERFQKRMDDLAKHVSQVHSDVGLINTSSQKISSRFNKIEQVELEAANTIELLNEEQL